MAAPLNFVRSWKKQRREARDAAWRSAPYVSEAKPIVVGGCPRSGTTLIRVILDTHPNLCCGPESEIFKPGRRNPARLADLFDLDAAAVEELLERSGSQAEFIDGFFELYRVRTAAQRWAEKTPNNIQSLDFLFEHFPKAKFIHMIRDGRDTICSLRTHPRHKVVDGELVKLDTNNPIPQCIETWVRETSLGLAWREDPRYFELRYEDIVRDPESTLRRVFEFLEEPWDAVVLSFHEVQSASRDVSKFPQNPEAVRQLSSSSLARWQKDLSEAELALFYERAGDLMRTFGYEIES